LNIVEDNWPAVTIGVCVKNSQKKIRTCLKSVLNCNYERAKLEIILVDGKSTDKTVDMARKILNDGQVKYAILSDEGKGLGYARQLVLENAKGKYICWVDGDNFVTRSFIVNHVKLMQNKASIGIALSLTLTTSRKLVARLEMYNWLILALNAFSKGKAPPDMLQGTMTPVTVLRKIGGFNIAFTGSGEDTDLFKRIRLNGYRIIVNPTAIVYHSMRESWPEVLKQMRWYALTQTRRPFSVIICEVFSNFFLRSVSLVSSFVKYSRDPICFFLPMFSLFQHTSFLIYYLSRN
jgi:glycosyltransferase involved in cell wall biosynthesis